jgi:NADH:ubiquinone oxidoreductase subunit K
MPMNPFALTLNHFLLLGALLFALGLYGALSRRNAVVILMSIELMFNGVNVTLVGLSRFVASATPLLGQIFAIFIITVAAAEAAVGLAIIIAIYRDRKTIEVPEIDLMKW